MTQKRRLLIIKIIAVIFGLMYVQSGITFIFTHEVELIGYAPTATSEIWVVRNLGARLLAIGVGFILAVIINNPKALALIFSIRIVADTVDFFNSMYTPNLQSFIVPVLGLFVLIEIICLLFLLKIIKKQAVAPIP